MRTSRIRLALFALLTARCAPNDPALLGTQSEAIVVCAHGTTVEGVDVSEYQGTHVDWNAVHASGREFAITRIGDGTYHDPTFALNWGGIRAAGMIRGAYQFFRPATDAMAQANIVCAALGTLGPGDLPAMLDLEVDGGVSQAGIIAAMHTWLNRVQECTGRQPIIYTAGWFYNPHVGSTAFGSYPLVVAAYGPRCPDLPTGWNDWLVYQYSDGNEAYTPGVGAVPGIGQSCDRDRYNGTLADLQRLAQSNRPPVGYLDHAGCDNLAGWSMDPDVPDTAIDVHLYIGGPAGSGSPGFPVHADQHRDDLCSAIGSCNHGYSLLTPLAFLDNADHEVFAYGIDAEGGNNPLLGQATFHCAVPAPPVAAAQGVRRHVPSPAVLDAWHLTFNDVAHVSDDTLNAFPDGPDVVAAPSLVRADSEDAVYLLENRTLRHVTSPAAMDAWRFSFASVVVSPAATVHANLTGADLFLRPFLAVGSGPAVYLIDNPPPLWAELVNADAPSTLSEGSEGTLTVSLHNRGSAAWNPGEVWLVPVGPREHDSPLCDASSWRSCRQAVSVAAPVAPGGSTTLSVTLRAPASAAPGSSLRECFALRLGEFYFSDPGQMGYADDALCRSFAITATPPVLDAGALPDGARPPGDAGHASDGASGDSAHGSATSTGSCGCRAPGVPSGRGGLGVTLAACAVALRRRRRSQPFLSPRS